MRKQVGDNLFVHAGLRPAHFGQAEDVGKAEEAMERMNAGVASWMLGGKVIPAVLFGEESPVWTRVYSSPDSRDIDEAARAELEEVRYYGRARGGSGYWEGNGGWGEGEE